MNSQSPSPDTVSGRAYYLWEQAGRPAGRDQEFWLQAEAELAVPARTSGVPPVIPPPMPAPPAAVAAAPAHQVPPAIKDAVKIPGRRPAARRAPKRA